jgi:hypothetical protein
MNLIATTVTSSGLCLKKPLRGARGRWWLRHPSGAFHYLARRAPGHRPFSAEVRLPEGRYVLGAGEIRIVVEVTVRGAATVSIRR